MNKRNKVKKLGKTASHRASMISTQMSMLFENGKVKTTSSKAKVLRSNAMRLMNRISKTEDQLKLSRDLSRKLNTDKAIEYAKDYVDKHGVSVKLVKIGFRDGDNAELSEVFLPEFEKFAKSKSKKGKSK